MDVMRAGVLREHIARQDAADAYRIIAVALPVRLGDFEGVRPARVAEQPVGRVVKIVVPRHFLAVGRYAGLLRILQLAQQPPALFKQLDGLLIESIPLDGGLGVDVHHRETRRQKARRQRSGRALLEEEGHVGRERVFAAAARFQLHRHHRTDRRDLPRKRQVELPAGLLIILRAEMHFFMAQHGPQDGEPVHVLFELGEQELRKVKVVFDLAHVQVFRRAGVLFEVESFHVADGAGDFVEQHVAGSPARLHLRCGALGGGHLERPNRIHRRAEQPQPTQLEQIATRLEKLSNGPCIHNSHL